jgi:anti-sigma B factor antagonist
MGYLAPMSQPAAPSPAGLSVHDELDDDHLRVAATGELDIATFRTLTDRIDHYRAGTHRRVTLDLRGLTFIDSSGMRALINADADARLRARELTILVGDGPARSALELTGLDQMLPIHRAA